MKVTRREWMRSAGEATIGAAFTRTVAASAADRPSTPAMCFFSKHLAELTWSDLGRAVKDAGFDGVDLTTRAKGHVLPERPDDLPRAIDAIRAHGVSVPMITTDVTSPADPRLVPLLRAAAGSGVSYFKPGYWLYSRSTDVRAQVHAAIEDVVGLGAIARDCGVQMGFHNHAGYIGAALWEIAPAIDRLDPKWSGYYFDPRHAVAEGGGGAWKAAAHLVAPRLKMVALKDFYWAKGANGWQIVDCPLGEGAVEWTWVASLLRDARFAGPISFHFEYEIPGATARERTARTLQAAAKDLSFARRVITTPVP
jgi:L-ribulose-5-phosphate 3-epimerase